MFKTFAKRRKNMLRFYFTTLTKSLSGPRHFFSRLPLDMGLKKPCAYLLISSIFFSAASALTLMTDNPLLCAGLYLMNAVGMTCISAGLGYVLIFALKGGGHVDFHRIFSIYAISSGTTLLAAWIPYFIILTEPWKWWLIGTGMIKTCRLSFTQAVLVIGLSIGIIVCAFRFFLPLTLPKPL
jgi:hypothetical protein